MELALVDLELKVQSRREDSSDRDLYFLSLPLILIPVI